MFQKLTVDEIMLCCVSFKSASLTRVNILSSTVISASNMEAKFLTINLCLLVLEATGARLTNLTPIQHRTENASKAAAVASSTSQVSRSYIGAGRQAAEFPLINYGRGLYKLIERHLLSEDIGTQIGFTVIAQTKDTRFVFHNVDVARALQGNGKLPPLKEDEVFPEDAQSNLVIAGVTYEGKPYGPKDVPYHSEQKLIPEMITMDDYNDHQQDPYLQNLYCPWLIMLGSTRNTCVDDPNAECQANQGISTQRNRHKATPGFTATHLQGRREGGGSK